MGSWGDGGGVGGGLLVGAGTLSPADAFAKCSEQCAAESMAGLFGAVSADVSCQRLQGEIKEAGREPEPDGSRLIATEPQLL